MLVRRARDVEPVVYGAGVEKRVLIGPRQGAPSFVMRVFDLSPSSSSPYHSHDWEHEVYVIDGQGAVMSSSGETAVFPGDAVLIVPGEMHCLKNTGTETFRFLCMVPLRGEDTP